MDALIYTAMSAAERTLQAQQVRANNLANLDTPGFRANMDLVSSQAVKGHGYDARHLGRLEATVVSGREGAVKATGRELDVALASGGYLAVEHGDGEAYTRTGALAVDAEGRLTVAGHAVLGDGGPIVLPPFAQLQIAPDGTIAVQPEGGTGLQPVDKLRLVRAAAAELTKNETGLLVARSGEPLAADATLTLRSGHLEGSNVSAVEEMVATMNLSRDFEMQMKLFKAADAMAESGNRLIRE